MIASDSLRLAPSVRPDGRVFPANDTLNVLIAIEDQAVRLETAQWFEIRGHRARSASSSHEALAYCERGACDVVVCDLGSPETRVDFLRAAQGVDRPVPVIVVVRETEQYRGAGGRESLEFLRNGATDFIAAPYTFAELELRCRMACHVGRLRQENQRLRAETQPATPQRVEPREPPRVTTGIDTASLAAVERQHILDVLKSQRGNKARTAVLLGIHRRKLYRLLDRLQISLAAR